MICVAKRVSESELESKTASEINLKICDGGILLQLLPRDVFLAVNEFRFV